MKLIDFINNELKKAGKQIDFADPKYADAKYSELLNTATIPDDIAAELSSGLMGVEGAINHPKVSSVIIARTFNRFNNELSAMAQERGFTDILEQFEKNKKPTGEYDTSANVKALLGRLETELEVVKKKPSTSSNAAKETELQTMIDNLNKQVIETKTTYEKQISDLANNHKSTLTEMQFDNMLNSYNFAKVGEVPMDLVKSTIKQQIRTILSDKKANLLLDENGLRLVTEAGNDYLDTASNTTPTFKQFLDSNLASMKVLATKESAQPQSATTQQTHQFQGAKPLPTNSNVANSMNAQADALLNS